MIRAGEILMLDYGSYSDVGYFGPYRAMVDFDIKEKAAECKAGINRGSTIVSTFDFHAFLLNQSLVEAVDCRVIGLGNYELNVEE